jgi:hypothetical protein
LEGGAAPLGTSSSGRPGQGSDLQVLEIEQPEVHLAVVKAAEETEIVDDGLASIEPGDGVVDIAPLRRASAAGSDAVAITARRSPAGITRVLRPTSSTSEAGPKTILDTEASQAS